VTVGLVEGLLAIAEPGMPLRYELDLASRSADRKLPEAGTTPVPREEEWSAEWSMITTANQVPVAVGAACSERLILLVNEDRGALGALRIYLLCAGYRVFAAANADEALDRAWMARMATSFIDIIIVDSELLGEDDGLAVIDKTRLLLGYDVPAVLLTTQTSIEIGSPVRLPDVFQLKNPVNLDDLNALIGEVLKGPRRCRLAQRLAARDMSRELTALDAS
jgi:ActR/RegA family two-component response regulator